MEISISEGLRSVLKGLVFGPFVDEDVLDPANNWPLETSGARKRQRARRRSIVMDLTKVSTHFSVHRPALSRIAFDELTNKRAPPETSCGKQMAEYCSRHCHFSGGCLLDRLLGLFPFISMLRHYNFKKNLVRDIVSGISVGMIHIPQGMGFAMLASVAPVYGLYSSFFPVLIYFFFGSSNHVSVGTMAIVSVVIRSVVERETDLYVAARMAAVNGTTPSTLMSEPTTAAPGSLNLTSEGTPGLIPEEELAVYRASIASAMSLVAGMIMLAMGIFRLGIITTFMPTSFIGGFTTGAAFHITTSQLKFLFGIEVKSHVGILNLPKNVIEVCRNLPSTNIATLVIALVVIIILVFFKEFINERFKKKLPVPIPIEMVVLILATVFSHFFQFNGRWSVRIVGSIPRGLPVPFIPPIERTPNFIVESFIVAILCFAITISMADIFARKYRYQVNTNQELVANGLSYGLSSFFYCFIGAAAPPRCFVLDSCGCKTQVSSIFTSLLLLLVLLVIGPLFQSLPNAVLACIIIIALLPLFKQFRALPGLWRISKSDFSIWLSTWLSSMILGIDFSLLIGIIWSLFTVALSAMTAKGFTLGQSKHGDLFAPTKTCRSVTVPDGIAIFRYESGLFFATVENFKAQLFKHTIDPQVAATLPTLASSDTVKVPMDDGAANKNGVITVSKVDRDLEASAQQSKRIKTIILDCSAFAHVDLMGLNALKKLRSDYARAEIRLILANCTEIMLEKLRVDGQIGGPHIDAFFVFPTLHDAIAILTKKKERKETILSTYM